MLVAGRSLFLYAKRRIVDLVDLVDSINLINKTLLIALIQLNSLSRRKTSAHPSILLYNKTIEISC